MKNRLIIISPRQYGYQTDYLKYVEYLPEWYRVTFICLDQGEIRFECNNAEIKYIKSGSKQLSNILFFLYTFFYLLFHPGKVMVTNFGGCRYLKTLMPWRKMIVNIRTVSVDKDPQRAAVQNQRILKDVMPFDRIIMISKGGAEQLHLPMEKVYIVGLGADIISEVPKTYESLHLLYVGTMNHRDIPKTVKGFHQYLLETGDEDAMYDIVGDGEELKEVLDYIITNELQNRIIVHGRKRYDELKPFFDNCNIGVAFVPINEAYRHQPPTKTYEYINSGLYVIATKNQVHIETVSCESGILIQDTSEDFCNALKLIKQKHILYQNVLNGGKSYLWRSIIENELMTSLEK